MGMGMGMHGSKQEWGWDLNLDGECDLETRLVQG